MKYQVKPNRLIWLTLLLLSQCLPSFADEIPVSGFYGNYDVTMKSSGQQALSLRGPKIESWNTTHKATGNYTIAVLLPSLKDSYWQAVHYGIMQQAKESGVAVRIVNAHGYENLETQQQQLMDFAKSQIDGIILASISYTQNNALVQKMAQKGMPVIGLVNDIEAGGITAKSMVSYYDMGFFAGEYVAEKVETAKQDVKVIFLPGPAGSGWASDTLTGFKAASEFASQQIDIVDIRWGDTKAEEQLALLTESLSVYPDADYVVGNAVAADVAVGVERESGFKRKIVSTYLTPAIYDEIKAGEIAAAPADRAIDQARIAVGMMVRLLNGEKAGSAFPFRAGPLIPVITTDNIPQHSFEELLGPRNYKAVSELKPE